MNTNITKDRDEIKNIVADYGKDDVTKYVNNINEKKLNESEDDDSDDEDESEDDDFSENEDGEDEDGFTKFEAENPEEEEEEHEDDEYKERERRKARRARMEMDRKRFEHEKHEMEETPEEEKEEHEDDEDNLKKANDNFNDYPKDNTDLGNKIFIVDNDDNKKKYCNFINSLTQKSNAISIVLSMSDYAPICVLNDKPIKTSDLDILCRDNNLHVHDLLEFIRNYYFDFKDIYILTDGSMDLTNSEVTITGNNLQSENKNINIIYVNADSNHEIPSYGTVKDFSV